MSGQDDWKREIVEEDLKYTDRIIDPPSVNVKIKRMREINEMIEKEYRKKEAEDIERLKEQIRIASEEMIKEE